MPASVVCTKMRVTGTVFWVYGKEKKNKDMDDSVKGLYTYFHTFLVVYQNRQLAIMDTNYEENTTGKKKRALGDMTAVNVVKSLRNVMKDNHRAVDRLWISTSKVEGINLQGEYDNKCVEINRKNLHVLLRILTPVTEDGETYDFKANGWEELTW